MSLLSAQKSEVGCYVEADKSKVKKILILTDVGEEIDDESALWMMLKVLDTDSSYEADVVFCTGENELRINRWCSIIRDAPILQSRSRVQYFRGNDTTRTVRHSSCDMNKDVLTACGLHDVPAYHGGFYDVVVQMSPLGDSETPLGALECVKLRDGETTGSYILIGAEGSTNFDKNSPIHDLFKEHLLANGFLMSIVAQENYAPWTQQCTSILFPKLQDEIYTDEWMKATGRINPEAVNLFVRFRVNVMVNYGVIRKGFVELEEKFLDDDLFSQATDWWMKIRDKALEKICDGYIKQSRDKDNMADFMYGNPQMEDMINGQPKKWMSLMTPEFQEDIVSFVDASPEGILEKCHVDTVMSWALLLMTERMARICVFAMMKGGGKRPEAYALDKYFEQSLGANHFLTMPMFKNEIEYEQINDIRKRFVANPQYDPSGMIVALALLAADSSERQIINKKLEKKEKLVTDEDRPNALYWAYEGKPPEYLLRILLTGTVEKIATNEKIETE